MKLSSLPLTQLQKRLATGQLCLTTGPYVCRIRSPVKSVAAGLATLYADYPLADPEEFADFHVGIKPPANLRRWMRRQVLFHADTLVPFKPLPYDQAFALLEWGLNWCVSNRINTRLIFHAAVLEKHGFALILPGDPGAGKSTLCAALANRGWRLLSDELTLVSPQDGTVFPLPRPISLKNESIEVIRAFAPEAVLGQISLDTAKGAVAHMRVPQSHIANALVPARPAWVVFPRYEADCRFSLTPLSQGRSALRLIENSFNYSILGERGFATLTRLVEQSSCYELEYSQLDEAIACCAELAAVKGRGA